MESKLCISVHFLFPNPLFHGRADGDRSEWPPSPCRLFQSLVSAAASLQAGTAENASPMATVQWLARQKAPKIVAPPSLLGSTRRIAVPNNDLNLVGSAWAKGETPKKSPAELKTMKSIQPRYLLGNSVETNCVTYVYEVKDGDQPDVAALKRIARAATHLGWGVDMVGADARVVHESELHLFVGDRWSPCAESTNVLRVPNERTLGNLIERHDASLQRLRRNSSAYVPPPSLREFQRVSYRRDDAPAPLRWTAFRLIAPDGSRVATFDHVYRVRDVAGMMRHRIKTAAERSGRPIDRINAIVHGKEPPGDRPLQLDETVPRFSYLPLPTVNPSLRRIELVRRILVAAPNDLADEIEWLEREFPGESLIDHPANLGGERKMQECESESSEALVDPFGNERAFLEPLPNNDWVLRQYVDEATVWTTVTPVILPRHDKGKSKNADDLLRLAFRQAGFPSPLVDQSHIAFRRVGFIAGVDLASRYLPPENLADKPRYHVHVTFPHEVQGPIAIGAGRFRGFGLFVRAD